MTTFIKYPNGILINSSFPECLPIIKDYIGNEKISLIITDPPYSGIVKSDWDNKYKAQTDFANWFIDCLKTFQEFQNNGDACYFWGGIGKVKNRPLFEILARLEKETDYKIQNLITWAKKRGIGAKYNYLFTREELTFLIKGKDNPNVFNIPFLNEKRECRSFNSKYPAKNENKRRTNIWSDVSDMFKHHFHECEKPVDLYSIPILASSNVNDIILDPFAGSGTAAIATIKNNRRFVLVEQNEEIFKIAKERIAAHSPTSHLVSSHIIRL